MCPKIIRIPTSVESWFLQPVSHQMLGFKPHFEKKGPDANPKIRFFIFRQLFFHFLKIFFEKKLDPAFWNHYLKDISLIRQRYSLIRRENVLIRREYARGRLTQIPPRPQQSHPKSYKVVPRPPKHINIGPKIQQNSNICEKLVFATPFTPNACFWSPRRPDSDPKII